MNTPTECRMSILRSIKETSSQVVAFVCYWLGLDSLFYLLNKNAKRIITFHNVLPDEIMGSLPHVGCMLTESDFKLVVNEISTRFKFSTDLADTTTVTLTFDDGFLNQYMIAGKILNKENISAIIFVAGDVIDATAEKTLITEKILIWNYFAPDTAVKKVFGEIIPRDKLWVKYVQPAYREDWRNRGKYFLEKLECAYGYEDIIKSLPPLWVKLRLNGVTQIQLEELRKRNWEIGWHTQSHYPLSKLDHTGKINELNSPKSYRKVVLSYPYGDIESIGEESLILAKQLGYPCAVSNDPDFSFYRNRFFLQRMTLSANKYKLHLELSGLKYFLKYRRLLPITDFHSSL